MEKSALKVKLINRSIILFVMDPEKAENFDITPHNKKITLLGVPLIHRRYGFCYAHRTLLIKCGETVYLWDREGDSETGVRKEFFFGEQEPSRVYAGNQFCFLEYCQIAHNTGSFPDRRSLRMPVDGLVLRDEEVIEKYMQALERIVRG